MEAKHTPGPWEVDGPPCNQIVWSSAGNRVCFLAHSNGLDDERDIATGHIIAAAPDLLKALKSIAEYPCDGDGRRTDDGYPSEVFYDVFAYKRMVDSYRSAARAAIASAT